MADHVFRSTPNSEFAEPTVKPCNEGTFTYVIATELSCLSEVREWTTGSKLLPVHLVPSPRATEDQIIPVVGRLPALKPQEWLPLRYTTVTASTQLHNAPPTLASTVHLYFICKQENVHLPIKPSISKRRLLGRFTPLRPRSATTASMKPDGETRGG